MHDDFGVGHLSPNEIDLSFHYGEVAMCTPLQDELASRRGEVLQLAGIYPDVER